MRPLASMDPAWAHALKGLVFDLDDTLLTHGRLTSDAFAALWRMHDAGLTLIAATGRPIGWAEVVARQWPIAGVVAENGALMAVREGGRVVVHDRVSPYVREQRSRALERVVDAVREAVPSLAFTDDSHHRRTDAAWDIGEHVRVDAETVRQAIAAIEAAGARASRSSVHVHASLDVCEKADGVLAFIMQVLGGDATQARYQFAYVGDSPNDESCFFAFRASVGVANVRECAGRLRFPPAFVTRECYGTGFTELANALLLHRRPRQK